MAFINNRLDFFNGESYGEVQHANAFAKGMPNFVANGLELTGTTLNSGIFVNNGTFGQLGSSNETHTITANYTGFVVIESTLSGRTSTSRIIESPTFLSTDPRTASNVRYFTIYELSNGSIVNDFRHIDYVKSFEVRNIGGSQFVFILNGFVSAPFDASVLAGNRTLINDKDIGYDDTIHATTSLQDILKDLFDKSRITAGGDKPFILSFKIDEGALCSNLKNALDDLILEKYEEDISNSYNGIFELVANTQNGATGNSVDSANEIHYYSPARGTYFKFDFDYDNWENVIVRDAQGYAKRFQTLWAGSQTNEGTLTLIDSLLNYESVIVVFNDGSLTWTHEQRIFTSDYDGTYENNISTTKSRSLYANSTWIQYHTSLMAVITSPTTLDVNEDSKFVTRAYIDSSGQSDFSDLTTDFGIVKIIGKNKLAVPRAGLSLETLPNLPPELTLKETQIQQDFYFSDDK